MKKRLLLITTTLIVIFTFSSMAITAGPGGGVPPVDPGPDTGYPECPYDPDPCPYTYYTGRG